MNSSVVLKLGKKKKKKEGQGTMNAKRILVGMESKWNFTDGLCILIMGKEYPQFLVKEHYLHSVNKQLIVSERQ